MTYIYIYVCDIYIWHIYMTYIYDISYVYIYIWHMYIYIWHIYMTHIGYIYDIYTYISYPLHMHILRQKHKSYQDFVHDFSRHQSTLSKKPFSSHSASECEDPLITVLLEDGTMRYPPRISQFAVETGWWKYHGSTFFEHGYIFSTVELAEARFLEILRSLIPFFTMAKP